MKFKKFMGNIILSILAAVIMLIMIEIFLNLFPKFTYYYIYPTGLFENAEAPLDFRLVPGFNGRLTGEYNADVIINSQGLRDYEHAENENYKILALGDSFTFGDGVRLEDTFLSIMEKEIGVEIIKAGVPAYGQDNELYYFRARGKDYNPDMAIIFYYLNDNSDNEGITDRKSAYGSLIHKYRYDSLSEPELKTYVWLFRIKTIRLIREASSSIIASFDKKKKFESAEYALFLKNQSKGSQEWKKTAALLEEFKENTGGKLAIAYVPDRKQIYPERFSSFFDEDTAIDKPNDVLGDISDSLNITYIDVTREMRELKINNLYFEHNPHFNENGHRLFATLAGRELIEAIKG